MSRIEMEHPSYPGYHGTTLSDGALEKLARVAEVMIPTAAAFPRAAALVPRFVAERVVASVGTCWSSCSRPSTTRPRQA